MQDDLPRASILIVQNGDYRDAYLRFADGQSETYRDQKRSVMFVAKLARQGQVTTAAFGPQSYRVELTPGLWAQGLSKRITRAGIAEVFDAARPSHVILRTPHRGFLREATRRGLWVLPCFADIFTRLGLHKALKNRLLRHDLLRTNAPCFANHSLNASRSLVDVLGLPSERVVPWDWSKVSLAGPPKTGLADPTGPSAFFAGSMTENKGVGDCLEALAVLQGQGLDMKMTFAGPGELDHWQNRAASLGIAGQVTFLGRISNTEVRARMRSHDFVIVPSRHSYAEGLPNTIYEALASRSVLIMSDHPAFAGRLEPDEEVLVFPAADPKALAACLHRGIETPDLYRTLSARSEQAHAKLYVGMEWTALVRSFLADPEDRTGWVSSNCFLTL